MAEDIPTRDPKYAAQSSWYHICNNGSCRTIPSEKGKSFAPLHLQLFNLPRCSPAFLATIPGLRIVGSCNLKRVVRTIGGEIGTAKILYVEWINVHPILPNQKYQSLIRNRYQTDWQSRLPRLHSLPSPSPPWHSLDRCPRP